MDDYCDWAVVHLIHILKCGSKQWKAADKMMMMVMLMMIALNDFINRIMCMCHSISCVCWILFRFAQFFLAAAAAATKHFVTPHCWLRPNLKLFVYDRHSSFIHLYYVHTHIYLLSKSVFYFIQRKNCAHTHRLTSLQSYITLDSFTRRWPELNDRMNKNEWKQKENKRNGIC